ncbi:Uu.00g125130.m01.CDS01 [Anthostomella pinea]|uniref:Uu.00g125130.m01.CDS01 n=1 Tax=Anthostomella pinea TaxID=933095 RepID=A0AAI8VHM1_9PEZI|nr:Uu.00g125130.m01.CDS01 [Anthostomella pinea]
MSIIRTLIKYFNGGEEIFSSPELREYYIRYTKPGSLITNSRKSNFRQYPARKLDQSTEETVTLLILMFGKGPTSQVGLKTILDALVTTTDTATRDVMSERLTRTLLPIVVLTDILDRSEAFQPWAGKFAIDLNDSKTREPHEQRLKKEVEGVFRPLERLRKGKNTFQKETVLAGRPTGQRFPSPKDRMMTRKNQHVIIKAIENLEDFWTKAMGELRTLGCIDTALEDIIKSQVIPPPAETAASPNNEPMQEAPKIPMEMVLPFAGLALDTSDSRKSGREKPRSLKKKTRGVPDLDRLAEEADE